MDCSAIYDAFYVMAIEATQDPQSFSTAADIFQMAEIPDPVKDLLLRLAIEAETNTVNPDGFAVTALETCEKGF